MPFNFFEIRLSILGTLLLLGVATASAQHPASTRLLNDTSPNQPEHYATMVAQFRSEPVQPGSILMVGNSITEGGNWQQLLSTQMVLNRGISGDNTFGIIDRLDEIIRHRPSKIFLLIGVNDISKDIPDEVIAYNVRQIIRNLREGTRDSEIFLQSLLPVNPSHPGFLQHFAKENHVIRTNRLLRTVAVDEACRFINLFPVFMDAQERLDSRFTYDGLHLSEAGYEQWASHLKQQGYVD